MSAQLAQTTQSLREEILSGGYAPNARLRENLLAQSMGVSRTLVRLALGTLEQDGLVAYQDNRGFEVCGFTREDVFDAIAVRGNLEAMAARLVAERGITQKDLAALDRFVEQMEAVLETGLDTLASRVRWVDLNADFHDRIVFLSGNRSLRRAIDHICALPLVSARAVVFNSAAQDHGLPYLRLAQMDHQAIVDAIRNRQGARAEALMSEHAHRSVANKRKSFSAMEQDLEAPKPTGLPMIGISEYVG